MNLLLISHHLFVSKFQIQWKTFIIFLPNSSREIIFISTFSDPRLVVSLNVIFLWLNYLHLPWWMNHWTENRPFFWIDDIELLDRFEVFLKNVNLMRSTITLRDNGTTVLIRAQLWNDMNDRDTPIFCFILSNSYGVC
jgi:hypothetical protein